MELGLPMEDCFTRNPYLLVANFLWFQIKPAKKKGERNSHDLTYTFHNPKCHDLSQGALSRIRVRKHCLHLFSKN